MRRARNKALSASREQDAKDVDGVRNMMEYPYSIPIPSSPIGIRVEPRSKTILVLFKRDI